MPYKICKKFVLNTAASGSVSNHRGIIKSPDKESQNIMKMIVADIIELDSDKFCHPISYFQITFISTPVNVLKSNLVEFCLF